MKVKAESERTLRWIESISVEGGTMPLRSYHQQRMEHTIRDHFGDRQIPNLGAISIPGQARQHWHKCRVVYDHRIRSVEWQPYSVKTVDRLVLKEAPDLNYSYKWADRTALNKLTADLNAGEDVLITQNGILRDTSYANILCYDGSDLWTPEHPLLHGTRRQFLLDEVKVRTAELRLADLHNFNCIYLVNALLNIDRAPVINIDQISRK